MEGFSPSFSSTRLAIFYDGLCPLCSREIEVYRLKDTQNKIRFVDILSPGFDPRSEGLDPRKVHQVFHVKTRDGEILTAVDAFTAIWKELPGFRALSWLAEHRASREVMDLGYRAFAKVRPLLPRRKASECGTGTCQR